MAVLILDPATAKEVLAERDARPEGRRREEVWDGVTVIMPDADIEHSDIAMFFALAFSHVFRADRGDWLQGPTNVSNRSTNWKRNYRCPDLSLFKAGNPAENRKTHWFGGPDFALEVVSPGDRSRDKLDFYASVKTAEVMILDRRPWAIELYRLDGDAMALAATTKPGGRPIGSTVVPFTFQLVQTQSAPRVRIVHPESGLEWLSREMPKG